jgi:hypothetical protein
MCIFIGIVVAITIANCITVMKTFGCGLPKWNRHIGTHFLHSPNNNTNTAERTIHVMDYLASKLKVDRLAYRTVIGFLLVTSFLASSFEALQTLRLQQAVDGVVFSMIQPNNHLPHDETSIATRQNSYVTSTLEHHQLVGPSLRGRALLHEGAGAAVRVFTQITFSAEYDQDLMPHTLQHYTDNGLNPEYMLITVHHGDHTAVEEVASAVHILQQFGVKHIQTWYGNFTSQKNCDMRQQHRRDVGVTDCDWIVKVDADEFIRVPGNDMPRFLQVLGSQHFDSVFGNWVDRVAETGVIPNITSTPTLSEQFPVGCRFSRTGNATTTKVVAFRGHLTEFRAGHYLRDTLETCRYPPQLLIDHYKWSWPVFTKLQKRIDHYKSIEGHHWWTESASLLEQIASNGGRIDVDRSDLSCGSQHRPEIDGGGGPMGGGQQPVLDSFYRDETNYRVCQSPLIKCPARVM